MRDFERQNPTVAAFVRLIMTRIMPNDQHHAKGYPKEEQNRT
jgi:hypothetical protein